MSTEAQAIAELVRQVPVPTVLPIEGVPHLVIPTEDSYAVHERESLLPQPQRLRGWVHVHCVASFLEYLRTYAGDRSVAVYADATKTRWDAVFDHHTDKATGWGSHRAVLDLVPHPDYRAWKANNKKWLSQTEFAEFLEEQVHNVVEPTAAELLDIITDFRSSKHVDFQSTKILRNGTLNLVWAESVTESRQIPLEFKLRLPVFDNSQEAYEVRCRLKYRFNEDKTLKWQFAIMLLTDMERVAWLKECEPLTDPGFQWPVFFGSPAEVVVSDRTYSVR